MRVRTNWWVFTASLLLVLLGMGWVSYTTIDVEKRQIEAEKRALLEENVRLALWRMDTKVAPLIRQEFAQPPWQTREQIANMPPAYIHLYFRLDEENQFHLLPVKHSKDLEQQFYQNVTVANLRDLPSSPPKDIQPTEMASSLVELHDPSQSLTIARQSDMQVQQYKSQVELSKRKSIFSKNNANIEANNYWSSDLPTQAQAIQPERVLIQEYFDPMWMDNELILARTLKNEGQVEEVEGVWFNWPELRSQLLQEIHDLLPNASLEPIQHRDNHEQDRLLATLPVRLLPGELALQPTPFFSPMVISLGIAWLCVLIAAGAILALLMGAISLSERRGAFVSAVTHELRTPLTTFRMYTEMLSAGMVASEEKRQAYLKTLSHEADRLSTLVENVLMYARIENHRSTSKQETITLQALLLQVMSRLLQRSEQGGMELVCDLPEELAQHSVVTDPVAIEHILFNLVDNAVKYAQDSRDKRIHLEFCAPEGRHLSICVRDHGSGIAAHEMRSIFAPFVKSSKHQSGTVPGVGLGLALARGLAKQIGGQLEIYPQKEPGASFCLSIPLRGKEMLL